MLVWLWILGGCGEGKGPGGDDDEGAEGDDSGQADDSGQGGDSGDSGDSGDDGACDDEVELCEDGACTFDPAAEVFRVTVNVLVNGEVCGAVGEDGWSLRLEEAATGAVAYVSSDDCAGVETVLPAGTYGARLSWSDYDAGVRTDGSHVVGSAIVVTADQEVEIPLDVVEADVEVSTGGLAERARLEDPEDDDEYAEASIVDGVAHLWAPAGDYVVTVEADAWDDYPLEDGWTIAGGERLVAEIETATVAVELTAGGEALQDDAGIALEDVETGFEVNFYYREGESPPDPLPVPLGTYRVVADVGGEVTLDEALVVDEDVTLELDVPLYEVSGMLLSGGTALPEGTERWVTLERTDGTGSVHALVEGGVFTARLTEGEYQVAADVSLEDSSHWFYGYQILDTTLVVDADASVTLTAEWARVTGTISARRPGPEASQRDLTMAWIAPLDCAGLFDPEETNWGVAIADDAGAYEAWVALGTYQPGAGEHGLYLPAGEPLTVTGDASRDIAVELLPVSGTLTFSGPADVSLQELTWSFLCGDEELWTTSSDVTAEGYEALSLAPGVYSAELRYGWEVGEGKEADTEVESAYVGQCLVIGG